MDRKTFVTLLTLLALLVISNVCVSWRFLFLSFQSNETRGSHGMEKEGLIRTVKKLEEQDPADSQDFGHRQTSTDYQACERENAKLPGTCLIYGM